MKDSEKSRRLPLLILISGVVCLSFMTSFFLGDNGVLRLRQLNGEYEKMREDNYRLAMENRRLMDEIRNLRTDPGTIEKIAREELRYVSPHDLVFVVPERQPSPFH